MRYSLLIAAIVISVCAAFGQGNITTIAGTGVCGYSGDLGPAVQATMCNPQGAVADASGNVYFADTANWRIRQIAPNGVITTIAGNGARGTSGDGGTATSASIGVVTHLAYDGLGHLCFGDQDAHKLRCVFFSSGTIAGYGSGYPSSSGDGGSFTNAGFDSLTGVEFVLRYQSPYVYSDIYIADGDSRLRRIDGATGIISTVVGPGDIDTLGDGGPGTAASLAAPQGLRYWNNAIYIADTLHNRIRKLDLATGIITTAAGGGNLGDGDPATQASIQSPAHVVFDTTGNMFLTDRGDMRVRKVDLNGIITTFAGDGTTGFGPDNVPPKHTDFNGLGGLAWNPVTNGLLIADGSNRLRQAVATGPSTTSFAVSPNPAFPGDALTLTATVTPAAATGNVNFYYGSSVIGTSAISNGVATFSWTPSGAGTYPLSAAYVGDTNYNPSTSSTVNAVVQSASTTTTLASYPNPSPPGQNVIFTATVTPAAATGTVQFKNYNAVLGSASLVNGVATFTTSTLAGGSTVVSALYGGDTRYASSQSAQVTQVVQATTTTGLSAVPNPTTYGSPVSVVAQVTPSSATGTVQFFNGSTLLASVTLDGGGYAHLMITTLPVGASSLTASYGGDASNLSSTSSPLQVTITKANTTTTLSVSPTTSTFGQTVTLSASVTPALATGTVQFFNGSTMLGSAVIANNLAQITTTALPVGNNSLTAVYGGDGNALTSTSAAVSQTVNKVASTTTLSASPAPSTSGQSVTLTATVTPAGATGTVQFFSGSTSLGSATITSGQAQLATTALPVGTDSLTAVYSGDANTASSTSSAVSQTVNKAASTTTLSASPAPSTSGQSVTLTATVTPASATGTVQLFSGSTSLGSATLTAGQAQLATTALPVGTDSLTAVYSGDANTAGSSSAAVSQTVNKVASATTLSASPAPSTSGQSVTLTATVTPASATGTVQFFSGSTSLGSATLTSGQAQLATTALPVGTDSLTAIYSGDGNTAGSTSAAVQQTVNKVASTTTLSASPAPSTSGQSVTLTATVTPAGATGTVQFFSGSTSLGSATLTSGQVQLATTALPVGTDSLTATYSGDANTSGSTSAAVLQTVNQASTTTSLTSSLNPSAFGASVTLTAAVTPSNATGAVQFFNGSTLLGSANLSGGQAQFTTTALPVGTNSLTAAYNGDANNTASTSAVLQQTVNRAVSTTSLALAGSNPSPYGSSVTLTATVSPSSATGTVQFFNGATSLGSANVSGGQAQFTTTTLPVGTASLSATYSGDTNNSGSTSSAIQLTVNKASTTATLTANPSTSTYGQPVTLTATVTPSSASGSVQFLNGSTVLGAANVSGGQAQYAITTLPIGTNSLTAIYSGDANYSNATSGAITQTVTKTATTTTVTSQNPSLLGSPVTFNATVSPATATGAVQLLDGTTVLSTATLASGSASFTTSTLTQGTHSITVAYGGDAVDASSTSLVLSQSILLNPFLRVGVNPSSPVAGQMVTLTANMNTAATGTVTFSDGSTVLATVTVANGAASYSTASLAAGAHQLGFNYSGDATYMNSGVGFHQIVLVASSVALGSSVNPSVVSQSVTFTAMVTPSAATGTVQFLDGGTVIGTAALASGVASFSTASLAKGAHSITAAYSGDSANSPATSASLTQTVKAVASVTLASSLNPSTVGQSVSFSATVTPSTATGTIQFLDGSTVLSTVTVNSGSVAFATSLLAAGTHSITAFYSGDNSDTAVTSAVLTQTVNVPPPAAPSNLAATAAGSSQINLTWTASTTSGVTYNVYASTSSGFTPSVSNRIASGVASTTYSNTGLSPSTAHYYRVTAVNAGGESVATNQASATTAGALACHISYSVSNQWNVGFTGALSIKNTGTTPINSWTLTWTWPGNQKVTQSWNSNYSQSGANVTFTNMSYNATIAPGATLSGVGFNASYSGSNPAPTAFSVNGTLCH